MNVYFIPKCIHTKQMTTRTTLAHAIFYQTDGEEQRQREMLRGLEGGKHTVFQLINFSNFVETQP